MLKNSILEYDTNIKKLIEWSHAYYVLDNPIATDEEYDKLARECKAFEEANPLLKHPNTPNDRVGAEVSKKFKKERHISRMWSQEDIFNEDELKDWLESIYKFNIYNFVVEPKYDGLSLDLVYDKGVLVKAITRGDGEVGEDVTTNAKTIRSIPLTIPYLGLLEIRGEVLMKKKDFDKLNEARTSNGEPLFANARNAAAGSLRQLDSKVTASRKLWFVPWGIGSDIINRDKDFKFHNMSIIKLVKEYGFYVPMLPDSVFMDTEIIEYYKDFIHTRASMEFMIDGMMIKVNDFERCEEIGYTNKFPRWSCAFKFPALEKVTTVTSIIDQVGRTGVITPVAIIDPIEIDGSIVSRATLHNYSEIDKLGLKINDKVILIKSGDIIPKITKVLSDRRTSPIDIVRPTVCPSCNSTLIEESIELRCINLECTSRVVNSIAYFASRDCAFIDGLGVKIIHQLVNSGLVKSIIDLYKLTKSDLVNLEGFKDKKIDNILSGIENSKGMDLYRLIAGLGIEHTGVRMSKDLCRQYGLRLLDLSIEELSSTDNIGLITATSIVDYINTSRDMINELITITNPKVENKIVDTNHYLYGKNIVITGSFTMPRKVIEEKLESLGAKIKDSVTSSTDILIAGESAGSKLDKAKKLGIEIKTFEEIL